MCIGETWFCHIEFNMDLRWVQWKFKHTLRCLTGHVGRKSDFLQREANSPFYVSHMLSEHCTLGIISSIKEIKQIPRVLQIGFYGAKHVVMYRQWK